MQERWRKLVEAIDRNEAFHKDQALQAGQKIETALNNLEPTSNCDELTVSANETASAILSEHKEASRERNERTDYGRKDGVSLI